MHVEGREANLAPDDVEDDHAQTIYWQRVEESSYTMTDSWDGVTLLLHRATHELSSTRCQ
jgi:hypothetical protein